MGHARILVRAVSNPGPPDHSFGDISDTPFTTLLSVQIAERLKADITNVITRRAGPGPGPGPAFKVADGDHNHGHERDRDVRGGRKGGE